MDAKKYDRQVELVDMTEAQELVVKIIMQEGALRFQDLCLEALDKNGLTEAAEVVKAVELEL